SLASCRGIFTTQQSCCRARLSIHCAGCICSYNRPHEEDHFHERSASGDRPLLASAAQRRFPLLQRSNSARSEIGQIVSGDIATQTRRVLDNIAAVLTAEGLTFDHVVKTTIFLTDLGDFQTVNEVYGSYFKQDPPARSTIQVAALPKGANVEIEVIAIADKDGQTAYDTSG